MNLRHLKDDELAKNTEQAASNEREATTVLLHHLCEVQRRRLFAKFGCDSLYKYCVEVLKMSEGHAGRRVTAARALAEFPEIEEKIMTGRLTLTTVCQAQSFFNRQAKTESPVSQEEKKVILQKLQGQSSRESEKILLSLATEPASPMKESVRAVTSEITSIRIAADEELMADLQCLKDIWSHEMPQATMTDVIKKMAQYCRKQLDPMLKAERANARKQKRLQQQNDEQNQQCHNAPTAPEYGTQPHKVPECGTPACKMPEREQFKRQDQAKIQERTESQSQSQSQKRSRYISSIVRHAVWARDKGCCTFKDEKTGRRCESRHRLQLDHIVPFAMGGENTVENLRLRCFAHNQWHAIQTYGPRVLRFMKSNTPG